MRRASLSIVSANSVTASSAPCSPQPAIYGIVSPSTARPTLDADQQRDGVDDHLGLRPRVLLIVDAERVRALVDQRPQLRVGRRARVDDDPLGLRVAPAAGRPGDRLECHRVPERLGERRSGASRCACESPVSGSHGGSSGDRLDAGQRLGLGDARTRMRS